MTKIVRVIEYDGPPERLEQTLAHGLRDGTYVYNKMTIRVTSFVPRVEQVSEDKHHFAVPITENS